MLCGSARYLYINIYIHFEIVSDDTKMLPKYGKETLASVSIDDGISSTEKICSVMLAKKYSNDLK